MEGLKFGRVPSGPMTYDDEETAYPGCTTSPGRDRPSKTMPASLWSIADADQTTGVASAIKRSRPCELVFIHQTEGGLFCERSAPNVNRQREKYKFEFFFAREGKSTGRRYPVTVRVTQGNQISRTAIIDVKDLKREPQHTGTAILHVLADKLGADKFCIKKPPKEFADALYEEAMAQKTADGYLVTTQNLRELLTDRLALPKQIKQ